MGGVGYGSSIDSTEILNVNTMTWGMGPSLPFEVHGNRGVVSVSGTYLGFSTGGYGQGLAHSKIYGLKKTIENEYIWEEVHSMTTGRYFHSIVNAPSSMLPNC